MDDFAGETEQKSNFHELDECYLIYVGWCKVQKTEIDFCMCVQHIHMDDAKENW